MNEYDYQREETNRGFIDKPQTKETQVNDTTEENPAVSKLREAFDTARNAILEGSALAIQVEELRRSVSSLNSEVSLLQRDLEYIRSRNKELDEQVTEVRRQRDNAIAEGQQHMQRADSYEADAQRKAGLIDSANRRIETLEILLANAARERDDAMVMALEYEGKLKDAEAKLFKLRSLAGEIFGQTDEAKDVAGSVTGRTDPKPVPHYEVQPRDEVGKFQPFDEGKVYPQGSQGESSF